MLKDFYDQYAFEYDSEYAELEKAHVFPYDEYHHTLMELADYIGNHRHIERKKILDLGIGTGELYNYIDTLSNDVTGIDFSPRMLEISKLKNPNIAYYEYDFLRGLPENLHHEKYDFILLSYTAEHLSFPALIDLIHHYLRYLTPYGKILIADVVFLDEISKISILKEQELSTTLELHFHVYNRIVSKIKENLSLSFIKTSLTTGIVIIENVHEISLQYEDNLIKYKTNTAKWKSTLSKKDRE